MEPKKFYKRAINLPDILSSQSIFLFGPRQSGKTTLIRQSLPNATLFDLASDDYLAIRRNHRIIDEAAIAGSIIVIDEIQRMPDLLDKVHHLIETQNAHFLLTGSYSRKLSRPGHNMLGGRAGKICLHPLLLRELGDDFNLQKTLQQGTMPSIYQSKAPRKDLEDYVNSYLRKTVETEIYASNLPRFDRLLEVAAQVNASTVNFSELSSCFELDKWNMVEYFGILQQMLHLFELRAWSSGTVRKATTDSKYFFYDIGTLFTVLGSPELSPGSAQYESAFKTWIMNEVTGWVDYASHEPLRYWRSLAGYEVDCLFGEHTAVLLKPHLRVGDRELRPLWALREEQVFSRYICVCLESNPRRVDDIEILPFRKFLENLWQSQYTTEP